MNVGWDLVPFLNKAQVHLVEVGWSPRSPWLGARHEGVLPGAGHLELGSLGTVSRREGVRAHLSRPCACWGCILEGPFLPALPSTGQC